MPVSGLSEEQADTLPLALIGWAVPLGETALDSAAPKDANSPFSLGLSQYIGDKNDIARELDDVYGWVYYHTSHRQKTDRWGTAGHVFLRSAPSNEDEARQEWFDVLKSPDQQKVLNFKHTYPGSYYASPAGRWLAESKLNAN
jgi:hypothetical protein